MNVLQNIFELVVYPVLSIGGIYLTYLISVKIKELKQKTNDDTAKKYLDMLNECGAINGYLDILSGELHCIRGARLPWLYAVEDGKNAREDGENLQIAETK